MTKNMNIIMIESLKTEYICLSYIQIFRSFDLKQTKKYLKNKKRFQNKQKNYFAHTKYIKLAVGHTVELCYNEEYFIELELTLICLFYFQNINSYTFIHLINSLL